jgi:pimeloyl-ACP methyl ester carboxylesterase
MNVRGTLLLLAALAGTACSGSEDAAAPCAACTGPVDVVSSEQVSVGDHVFDVLVAGPKNGPVVFLLHGFPQTSYEWRHQLPVLAGAGFRVLAPDQRGYSPGARPSQVEAYAVADLVGDVLAIADVLGAERFHVVGHDWGAAVAWGLAGVAPERVLTVTPVSVPHPAAFAQVVADPASCQHAASAYFDFFVTPAATDYFVANDAAGLRAVYAGIPAEDVQVYVDALGTREAIDAALNWYRANIADRRFVGPVLGAVRVPTLFLWGDQDTALCRDGVDLTEQFVEAPYRLQVLEGVNHWVPENAPDQVNTRLLEHLGAARP